MQEKIIMKMLFEEFKYFSIQNLLIWKFIKSDIKNLQKFVFLFSIDILVSYLKIIFLFSIYFLIQNSNNTKKRSKIFPPIFFFFLHFAFFYSTLWVCIISGM